MKWLEHIDLLPLRDIMPGMRGRFLHSERMTFAFWEIEAGFALPEHSHLHEQVAHMIEGEFTLIVDGVAKLLHPGAMTIIPPNAPHSGVAHTACRIMDIFYPRREDYDFGQS
ncbi:MAG: cupin domain-containing protein [Proteobacteria bacterium]|nr:cupin domain-containing protein [Pseudomonadota bacterium]